MEKVMSTKIVNQNNILRQKHNLIDWQVRYFSLYSSFFSSYFLRLAGMILPLFFLFSSSFRLFFYWISSRFSPHLFSVLWTDECIRWLFDVMLLSDHSFTLINLWYPSSIVYFFRRVICFYPTTVLGIIIATLRCREQQQQAPNELLVNEIPVITTNDGKETTWLVVNQQWLVNN